MATLVKIRGLERDKAALSDGSPTSGSYRGFRVKSGLGSRYDSGAVATKSGGAGNNKTIVTAKYGGTWANDHVFTYATTGADHAVVVTVAYASVTGVPTWTYTCGSAATIAEIVAALNADVRISQFYVASTDGNGTGTTPVSAGTLAGGTDVGAAGPIYQKVGNKYTVFVDVDDSVTQRQLKRNHHRYISLGAV